MAVRLRLTRTGKKKQPSYRIVAADSRSPRDGRFIEILGWYDPKVDPPAIQIDLARIDHWLGTGATASETVASLIARARKAGPVEG
ncbi:MAG: 30S ribosomal protein S16 [Deltaproteobacteria bacterium]|nr:30S ribosomal protein S16 [Deltaproteobacteria bacterium]